MVRVSLRILILCLIISLGVGIGIGHAIETKQIQALNSEISQQEEQVSDLRSEVEQLRAKAVTLASDLQEKQVAYDSLLAKQGSVSEELRTLQVSYADLDKEYQSLQEDHEALQEACNSATTDELIRLREQISSLNADKSSLNSRLSEMQIENAKLKAALNEAKETNATLTEMIGKAESEKDRLNVRVAQLTKQLTPSPDHAVTGSQIWGRPEFRSTAWEGRAYALQSKIEEIGRLYNRTHTYILGETDCNDMAVDLWNMLLTEDIKSVIVIGNLEKVSATFEESDHAWLYVFDAQGKVIYLEPTEGKVLYGRLADGSTNPEVIRYRDGFIYEKPSDLWKDIKKMW